MKKIVLILGLTLGLTSPVKADTIWTLVSMLLVDDFRYTVSTTVFKNKEDCRTAAIKKFIEITGREEGITVQENRLAEPDLIEATLLNGKGKFSGSSTIYILDCNPSAPVK